MDSSTQLSAIALAISLLCFAIASLSETSIASVSRERIQHMICQGVFGSVALRRLHSSPTGPTAVVFLSLQLLLAAAMISSATLIVTRPNVNWWTTVPTALAVLVLAGVLHSVATKLGAAYAEQIAPKVAVFFWGMSWLFNPLFGVYARLVVNRPDGFTSLRESRSTTLPRGVNLSLESSNEPLDEREVRMIRGVIQQDKTTSREIMIPRVDMITAEVSLSITELAEQMTTGGHSRVPVYDGDLDHIKGIAYARDVLRHLVGKEGSATTRVGSVIRPALFIPESKTLEELLHEFQQRRVHMAIVVDEYGGVSGLVTIEDLLEEIVGEIQDEFDTGEPEIKVLSDDEFLMDARVSVDQVKDLLSVTVDGDGFDSLGGFIYHRLGRIPSLGDSIEYNGLRIEVVETVGRRLKMLRVTRATAT